MAGPASTLNAPPKRTAFGDLSNTGRTFASENAAKDIPKNRVKSVVAAVNLRDARVVDDKENPSRPAASNGAKYLSAAPISAASGNLVSKPANRGVSLNPVVKQGAPKKLTTIFYDNKATNKNVRPQVGSSVDDLASLLADKPVKNPRHYRSQPQLKTDQQTLRRTQSRYLVVPEKPVDTEADDIDDNVTEAAYEDAVEEISNEYDAIVEQHMADVKNEEFKHASHVDFEIDHDNYAELVPHPKSYTGAISEPEEYWDEDDEPDLYDEQGYTTAHSYRSHGDNTTGGVTTLVAPKVTTHAQKELEAARQFVLERVTEEEEQEEAWDVSLVAEYGEEIFEYMRELEVCAYLFNPPPSPSLICLLTLRDQQIHYLPNPHYMDIQTEIQWSMRSVLMDWLVQVHQRFHLLPETLFLTVNYIDRFLSVKVVSLAKLQLVGATAILIAAKVEEVTCPSVQEIVFMVDKGFTCDEILKAERFMLSMLQFEMNWPGPMSFLRRISKGDDYDLETRTLAKYFLEVTIMDERFVGCPASYLAAGAHCLSRMILKKGDWTLPHIHWSGYTLAQLRPLITMVFECCKDPRKHHLSVYEKYSSQKYHRASTFVETNVIEGWSIPFPTTLQLTGNFCSLEDDSHTLDYSRMSLAAES